MKTHENLTDVFHCHFTGFLLFFQRIFVAQVISSSSLDFHPTKIYNQQMQHVLLNLMLGVTLASHPLGSRNTPS